MMVYRFVIFWIVLLISVTQVRSVFNATILILMPASSLAYSYDYYGPVTDMAIEELNRNYPRFHFKKHNFVPSTVRTCEDLENIVSNGVVKYMLEESRHRSAAGEPMGITVLSGTACSITLRWIGDIAREMNIPVISSGGSAAYMFNSKRFSTMVRMLVYEQPAVGAALVGFMRRHKWINVALICDDNPGLGDFILLACGGFSSAVKGARNMSLDEYHINTKLKPSVAYEYFLTLAAQKSRIIAITAMANVTRLFMIAARNLGMTNGYFVYVTAYPFEHQLYGYYQWEYHDQYDDAAREAFKSLYFISTRPVRGPGYIDFEQEVKYRSWRDYKLIYQPIERVNAFTAFQHTLVRYAGKVINDSDRDWSTLEFGDGAGRDIMLHANERQLVSSVTGDFVFDRGEREQNIYVVVAMNHRTYDFREVFTYDTSTKEFLPVPNTTVMWANRDSPPPNEPECGFVVIDNQCTVSQAFLIGIVAGIVLVSLFLASGVAYMARRTRRLQVVDDPHWYVSSDDIVFEDLPAVPGQQSETNLKKGTLPVKNGSRTMEVTRSGHVGSPGHSTVLFRGVRVWLKRIPLSYKYAPTAMEERIIRKMKAANSENLLRFYGFCPSDVEMDVLYEIAWKGNLIRVMQSGAVKLDTLLKSSIAKDLTNGLLYLHTSSVDYHGSLSRFTCFLSSRLVLKLAYFRLDLLPREQINFATATRGLARYLVCSPEQLRSKNIHLGSKESDIYSYGHVLAEMVCEVESFQTEIDIGELNAREIIGMIRQEGKDPFRPKIPSFNILSQMKTLIDDCWRENPADRPTIQEVNHVIRSIPGFDQSYSLVDQLMSRLNAHAEILEKRIAAATEGLSEEKKRAEEILLEVLPKHVSDALKRGETIDPEAFNSATIGFTALENFGVLASTLQPIQVVALLNDLYTLFDSTISLFDVYKVETISDSYMIASGLPVRNGHEHSKEIANTALMLLDQSDGRQLKVGFHTGPCVAGVIGNRMPRYCLFGDTINMASRMTSSGQAPKIQVSEEAKDHLTRNWGVFRFQFRGVVEIKGKGPRRCYWLLPDVHPEQHPVPGEPQSTNGSDLYPNELENEAGRLSRLKALDRAPSRNSYSRLPGQ